MKITKNQLLATLEFAGVNEISCGSHCSDSWSLDTIAQNLDKFKIINIDWSGELTTGEAFTFANKEHDKEFQNERN